MKLTNILLLVSLFTFHLNSQTSLEEFDIKIKQCEDKLTDLQDNLYVQREENEAILSELRSGKFCSKCRRSATEIIAEKNESFSAHIGRVSGKIISLSSDELRTKERELERKIEDLEAKLEYQQQKCWDIGEKKIQTQKRLEEERRQEEEQKQKEEEERRQREDEERAKEEEEKQQKYEEDEELRRQDELNRINEEKERIQQEEDAERNAKEWARTFEYANKNYQRESKTIESNYNSKNQSINDRAADRLKNLRNSYESLKIESPTHTNINEEIGEYDNNFTQSEFDNIDEVFENVDEPTTFYEDEDYSFSTDLEGITTNQELLKKTKEGFKGLGQLLAIEKIKGVVEETGFHAANFMDGVIGNFSNIVERVNHVKDYSFNVVEKGTSYIKKTFEYIEDPESHRYEDLKEEGEEFLNSFTGKKLYKTAHDVMSTY